MSAKVTDSRDTERAKAQIEAERPRLEFGGSVWDYAPAPESKDHVRLEKKYGLFISGQFVTPRWPRADSRTSMLPFARRRTPIAVIGLGCGLRSAANTSTGSPGCSRRNP